MPVKRSYALAAFVLTLLGALVPQAQASGKKTAVISMWTRKKGSFGDDQNPSKGRVTDLDLMTLKLQRRSLVDLQYGRKLSFRGIPLVEVLKSYERHGGDDLALLHFDNGMIVPVPVSGGALAKINAFVAVGVCEPKGTCASEFEPVAKADAYSVTNDPRPIEFAANKLVVGDAWHPETEGRPEGGFSPWRYVDSLSGVEFVNAAAYYRQFELGDAAGLAVFRHRCQFCHGVRYVGATFGWDFVKPLALYEKRPPDQLLNHVKYPKTYAKERGLMMPAQTDIDATEIKSVWLWMRSAALRQKMPSYSP